MNKYHDGEKKRWLNRMIDAGWRLWVWVEPGIMWRHADKYSACITIDEAQDYFRQYVNTGSEYIPSPYEVLPERMRP